MKNKGKFPIYPLIILGVVLMLANGCKKNENNPIIITTDSISYITQTTALCKSNIISEGSSSVTERGICWSTEKAPTVWDSKDTNGTGTGSFICVLTGLTANTSYYVRAYASNSGGTSYGNELFFSTTVIDIDGNLYNTTTIGTQIWMVENLKTTKYRDGTTIPNITDAAAWAALSSGAYCDYNNTPSNSSTYGKLYNYYSVVDERKLCPIGWHVPTDTEWATLLKYIGGEDFSSGKLKESGSTHWIRNSIDADNSTGFTALPGGYRDSNGRFEGIGWSGDWWSSTMYGTAGAYKRSMNSSNTNIFRDYRSKLCGYSIRCLKD